MSRQRANGKSGIQANQASAEAATHGSPGRRTRVMGLVQRSSARTSPASGAPVAVHHASASPGRPNGQTEESWRAAIRPDLHDGPGASQLDPVQRKAEPSVAGSDAEGKDQEVQEGDAFIKGAGDALDVDPNDVVQGQLGDCWLLAGLQAVAAANPQAIRDMVKPAGQGKWTVTFYFPGTFYGYNKETVTVDAKVPVSAKGKNPLFAQAGDQDGKKKELWVLLVEKAYAKTQGSYLKIEGDKHPQDHRVLEMITGKGQKEIYPNQMKADEVLEIFANAMAANKGVTLASIKDDHAKAPLAGSHNPKIITNHGYSLIKVDKDARTVDLRNPWGDKYNALGLSIDDLVRFFRRARVSG